MGGTGSAGLVASLRACRGAGAGKFGTGGAAIDCVGFSGQMHGAVLLDSRDELCDPPSSGATSGREPKFKELSELFGVDRLIQLTCNPHLLTSP